MLPKNSDDLVLLARHMNQALQYGKTIGLISKERSCEIVGLSACGKEVGADWVVVSSAKGAELAVKPCEDGEGDSGTETGKLLFSVARRMRSHGHFDSTAWVGGIDEKFTGWGSAQVQMGKNVKFEVAWPVTSQPALIAREQLPKRRIQVNCAVVVAKASLGRINPETKINVDHLWIKLELYSESSYQTWKGKLQKSTLGVMEVVMEESLNSDCVEVPAAIEIGVLTLPLEATLALKPGVRIQLDMPEVVSAVLTIDGMPIARGEIVNEDEGWSFVVKEVDRGRPGKALRS